MDRVTRRTSRTPVPVPDDLGQLAETWRLSLESANLSPRTIATYTAAVSELERYLIGHGAPRSAAAIERRHLESFMADLLARVKPATASIRYRALQQFWKFLVNDEGIPSDAFARLRAPIVPENPPPVITDEELRRLLAVCEGRDFVSRRDSALVRVLLDTGMRRGELAGMAVDSVDMEHREVRVTGKGRRERVIPFGTKTALALRRYLLLREARAHGSAALWIGHSGPLTGNGIYQILRDRAREAGLSVHPHQLRHTFAHAWLASGGQEHDLMRLAGWKSRQMLGRYGASAADERARSSHRRLGLGDRV